MKYLIGIDEAGRGPLAGPVAVGVVSVPVNFDWGLIPGVGDSKKMTPKNREAIFRQASDLRRSGQISWRVSMTSSRVIDKIGIVPSVNLALRRALASLERQHFSIVNNTKMLPRRFAEATKIKLDGGLRAPRKYLFQETIIRGDASEPVIGLASILAKVTRDRYMTRLSKSSNFTAYDFETHKGYGTKKHREIIAKIGLSAMHRRSFCGNLLS